jgi:hypothetical protein
VFFEGAKEALNTSISLRLTNELRGRLDTQKLDLGLKSSLMYTLPWSWRNFRPSATPGVKAPKDFPDTLAHRFESFERVAFFTAWMPTYSAVQ